MTLRASRIRSRVEDILHQAERSLTDPAVRRSESLVSDLLHPEFTEVGSSGEVYEREAMIEMMTTESPGEVIIRDFTAEPLSEDAVLVRYRSVGTSGQEARRSSIWVRSGEKWQLRYHQGTRVPNQWGRVS
jgi:ribonuclease HI